MTRPAPAVVRSTAILDFLSSNPSERYTLSEISQALDINMASALAILTALGDAGYVHRHPTHKTYALGPALVALGTAAMTQHRAIGAASEIMQKLALECETECVASVVVGGDIVIVLSAGRPRATGNDVRVGQHIPMIPPLGGIFMAWDDEAMRARWFDGLGVESSVDERRYYEAALAGIRERGFSMGLESGARAQVGSTLHDHVLSSANDRLRGEAVDLIAALRHDYEVVDMKKAANHPVSNIAAPVFGPEGDVVLGLTLQGFGTTLSARDVATLSDALMSSALQVTRLVGGRKS